MIQLFKKKKNNEYSFIENFNFHEQDIVIAAYPKSGSTWLRFIFANIRNSRKQSPLEEVDFPNMEALTPSLSKLGIDQADIKNITDPRVFRTHLIEKKLFPRTLHLIRDGRDVLVSYWHHFQKYNNYKKSLDEFISEQPSHYGSWSNFVDAYLLKNSNLENTFTLKYEELKEDPITNLTSALNFFKFKFSTDELEAAIEKSSFKKLKNIEKTKGLSGTLNSQNKTKKFIRKGKAGGWKEEFNSKTKDIFKSKYGDTLIKLGYEQSYDW